jgi:hypothetical protein
MLDALGAKYVVRKSASIGSRNGSLTSVRNRQLLATALEQSSRRTSVLSSSSCLAAMIGTITSRAAASA